MEPEGLSVVVPQAPPSLRVSSLSGRVSVIAEARADVLVSGRGVAAEVGEEGVIAISATPASSRITVRCPLRSRVAVGTASGDVEARGDLADVRVTSASGSISVESAQRADLRSQSGKVALGSCERDCRIQTSSGTVSVESSGMTEVSTASGRVRLGHAAGKTRVRTASGKVDVAGCGHEDITVQTMSGGVTVTLPPETRPAARLISMTGTPRCELPDGKDCLVAVQTMQGAIEVVGDR